MSRLNRRSFISAAAGAAALTGIARGGEARKLRLGLIGAGGYGMSDVRAAWKVGGVEIAAICDVDTQHLETNAAAIEREQGTRPKTFKDYRELIDMNGLDAVIIATPPHWHALPFIAACKKGLAVYCEKPVAYDVREGQAMVAAAKKAGNIVQIGFQRRQSAAIKQAADYIRSGEPGKVVQVDVQIHYNAGPGDPTVQEPPASLDWDAWCGPAPKLPYRPSIGHVKWRLEKEYGNGHLVDWGIHLIDATRVSLGLGMPKAIQAAGGIYALKGKITTPDVLTAHFDFDECPVIWRHHIWGAASYRPEVDNGIFFRCEKQTVFATDRQWMVINKGREPKIDDHSVASDMGTLHMEEFLTALREGKQPACQPEDAWRSTATVQLAMIAYQVESKIHWDAATERITNNPAAAKLLKREYRAPYKHPYTA